MKLKFYYLIFLLSTCYAYSQPHIDKHRIALTASLGSSDTYDFKVSYHYKLIPNIGVGGGIGYLRQWYNDYIPHGKSTNEKWSSWELDNTYKNIDKLYLNPSVILQTPTLFKLGKKYNVMLMSEPGLQLIVPYTGVYIDYINSHTFDQKSTYISSNKGNWCYWNLKGGIGINSQDVSVILGYGISNFDIYSTYRTLTIENTSFNNFYPNKKLMHSLYICIEFLLR